MIKQEVFRISLRGLWLAFCNLTLATYFGLFAYAHALNFFRYQRLSNLLIVAKESLDAVFFLARRAPLDTSKSSYHWAVGIGATFGPTLFRPLETPLDLASGQFMQVTGLLLQVVGIASLNRSFGIVAANRGIKTGGLYRYVRHPLYSAYILQHIGYVLNNLSAHNCVVFGAVTVLQLIRMIIEERFLAHDPAYVKYMAQTRRRLIPFVL
jgi:protein-S-isoprenylcysteine O-methyltransferase Ste14